MDIFGTEVMSISNVSMTAEGGKYKVRNLRFTSSETTYTRDSAGNISIEGIKESRYKISLSMSKNRWKTTIGDSSLESAVDVTETKKWDMEYNALNQLISYEQMTTNADEKQLYHITGDDDLNSTLTLSPTTYESFYLTSGTTEFTVFVGNIHEDTGDNQALTISLGNVEGSGSTLYELVIRETPDYAANETWIWQLRKLKSGGETIGAGTAYEILSIDIADVDVGENVGAKLQADQAEADKRRFQAIAEQRRAAAKAREQEMSAEVVENRAKVMLQEAEIPKAIAEAFRDGNLGIMDYYRLRNLQADTRMRDSIGGEGEPSPEDGA